MTPTNELKTARAPRTETATVRFDPRLRYLAELAAKAQRRTFSSFVEWAVEQALQNVTLDPAIDDKSSASAKPSVAAMADKLWDVDPFDRLDRLAHTYPHLLTYDDQRLLKLIYESDVLSVASGPNGKRGFSSRLIRENWELLTGIVAGAVEASQLDSIKKGKR